MSMELLVFVALSVTCVKGGGGEPPTPPARRLFTAVQQGHLETPQLMAAERAWGGLSRAEMWGEMW